jgi:hypothetical protein
VYYIFAMFTNSNFQVTLLFAGLSELFGVGGCFDKVGGCWEGRPSLLCRQLCGEVALYMWHPKWHTFEKFPSKTSFLYFRERRIHII